MICTIYYRCCFERLFHTRQGIARRIRAAIGGNGQGRQHWKVSGESQMTTILLLWG